MGLEAMGGEEMETAGKDGSFSRKQRHGTISGGRFGFRRGSSLPQHCGNLEDGVVIWTSPWSLGVGGASCTVGNQTAFSVNGT